MSKEDIVYYEKPLLGISLIGNRLFAKGSKNKIIGEYRCSNGSKLAVLDKESYLFDFDDFEIKVEWVDRKKIDEMEE